LRICFQTGFKTSLGDNPKDEHGEPTEFGVVLEKSESTTFESVKVLETQIAAG
jgi:hypothetical protein